jgi:hypothetical protein
MRGYAYLVTKRIYANQLLLETRSVEHMHIKLRKLSVMQTYLVDILIYIILVAMNYMNSKEMV